MARITYRANLSAKAFPFLSFNEGRTVIVPGPDNTFSRQLASTEDPDKDIGIPQLYYCENVMPTTSGFQSIGYDLVVPAIQDIGGGVAPKFISTILLRDAGDSKAYLGICANGILLINTGAGWSYITSLNYSGEVSSAYVGGITYIYFPGLGCYYYDFALNVLTPVTLAGLSIPLTLGICASYGYLIAWTKAVPTYVINAYSTSGSASVTVTPADYDKIYVGQTITSPNITGTATVVSKDGYVGSRISITLSVAANVTSNTTVLTTGRVDASFLWSSTIDPTDFVPSLTTGAGGGSVEGVRGAINIVVPHTLGVIIYTTNNAVAALFSGNTRYPWNFREIVNSGGVASEEFVSFDSNTGNHYAYTTSGLQLISTSQSQTIFPEVTDFISGGLIETFDPTFLVQLTQYAKLKKKISVVCDRYLVISYGGNSLTHALVYDLAQKRWGKVAIPHVDCFEFFFLTPGTQEIAKNSFAFLKEDGTVQTVNFTPLSTNAQGVAIFGKYQYARARWLVLDEVEIENAPALNLVMKVLSSYDGHSVAQIADYYTQPGGTNVQKYYGRSIGLNHSLLLTGTFYLSSIILTFHLDGKR